MQVIVNRVCLLEITKRILLEIFGYQRVAVEVWLARCVLHVIEWQLFVGSNIFNARFRKQLFL